MSCYELFPCSCPVNVSPCGKSFSPLEQRSHVGFTHQKLHMYKISELSLVSNPSPGLTLPHIRAHHPQPGSSLCCHGNSSTILSWRTSNIPIFRAARTPPVVAGFIHLLTPLHELFSSQFTELLSTSGLTMSWLRENHSTWRSRFVWGNDAALGFISWVDLAWD